MGKKVYALIKQMGRICIVTCLLIPRIVAQDFVQSDSLKVDTQDFFLDIKLPVFYPTLPILKPEAFNQGTIHQVAQLIQGRIPGLSIARSGGDPNEVFQMRLRGISSITGSAEPLVVVDGIPGTALHTLDPSDVTSIRVLKDVGSTALYGIRGGSGVVLIDTKPETAGKIRTSWNSTIALETMASRIPVLSADAYRQQKGAVDFGATTDWLELISRKGYAHTQHLSFSGGTPSTIFRSALHYRDVQGIGLSSGFQQLNARMFLRQYGFKQKAVIEWSMAATSKILMLGDPNSFRYALSANPTMPVYDYRSDTPTAGARFGGYAQREIFDFYNPLAIVEQNVHEGSDRWMTQQVRGQYRVSNSLQIAMQYATQTAATFRENYSSKTSKYGGGVERNGLASRHATQQAFEFLEAALHMKKSTQNLNFRAQGGYSFQGFMHTESATQGGNFLSDAFSYYNLGASLDFTNGKGIVSSFKETNRIVAFFGNAQVTLRDRLFLSATGRYEGSSRLGSNNKWGIFPALNVAYTKTNIWTLRTSWGMSGNQPGESYLSLQRFGYEGNFFYNGSYMPTVGVRSNSNPTLSFEKTKEWNIGLDIHPLNKRFEGTIDYYIRRIQDLIMPVDTRIQPNLAGQTWMNAATLQYAGLDISLHYKVLVQRNPSWISSLNLAVLKARVQAIHPNVLGPFQQNLGGPGQGSVDVMRLAAGEQLGILWGPVLHHVASDGTAVFEDLNEDGIYCDCDADKTVIGYGLPTASFGWNNSFKLKQLDLNILFRGVLGHDLLNSYRLFYESAESFIVSNYNVVTTKYYTPETRITPASSLHIEDADFIRLEYIALGYQFKQKTGSTFSKIRVYLTGQHLLTLSRYTGMDPEVRYPDTAAGTRLYPGIERRTLYPTTSTFTLGIQTEF